MRTALLALLLISCSKDPASHPDASIHVVDAPKAIDAPPPPPDAAVDAPPDAPNMDVVQACTDACNAISACLSGPTNDPDCIMGCETDLADCSTQQVAAIDACKSQMCGDIENNMSPLIDCITAVSCVQMAFTSSSK